MVGTAKIPVRMSVEEFFAWDAGDGRLWQLVDGEPLAPANRTHGALHGVRTVGLFDRVMITL